MPIYYGGSKISEIYNGGASIKEVYNGSDLVFSSGATIEYGMFSTDSNADLQMMNTFLPDFETSTTCFYLYRPTNNSSYPYTCGNFFANIKNYKDKNSFVYESLLTYNMTYKGVITFNGIKYQEYFGSAVTSSSYTTTIYLPDGFILNTSWFLEKIEVVKSRGSDLSYVNSVGYTWKLRSRHKVNLITGEEQ